MWQIMAFFLGALGLAVISRRVFADPRSHGFFRFLAFLAIWAIIVINAPRWFSNVLSPAQIVSWILLLGSLGLAASGFIALHKHGKPRPAISSTDFAFEQTTHLVMTGPYRFIRHPLYASLILLAWGSALKYGTAPVLLFGLLATALLYLTARAEEYENLERFGSSYEEYISRTRMFVPGLF
jgi:protein-S-isoprenylcysteine O-methyltransferase Ste14